MRFTKALDFKKLFDQAYSPTTELLTAHSCVLVEQPEHNVTQMTTLEPGKAIVQRRHIHTDPESGGEPGTQFLIDQAELNQKLARLIQAKVGSLLLRLNRGALTLIADYGISANKQAVERGRLTARQYGGAISDFKIPFEPTIKVTTINKVDFVHWVRLLRLFGQFNEKSGPEAGRRTVLLDFADDSLTGAASHKGAYMCYTCLKLSAQCAIASKLAIEGRHLKRLVSISDQADVDIYIDNVDGQDWVSFCSDLGRISVKADTPEKRFIQTYAVASQELDIVSERLVAVDELEIAANLQLPDAKSLQQDLLLGEKPPNLVLLQASNVKGTERAFVSINPTEEMEPWTTVLVNGVTLLDVIRTAKSYTSLRSLPSSNCLLSEKTLVRKSSTKAWLLFINPFEQAEGLTINTFILVKPGSEVPDILDSDE